MKRIGNLYDKLLDKEYIAKVIRLSARGKTKRGEVQDAMYNIDRKLREKGLRLKRIESPRTVEQSPIDFIGFRFCKDKIYLRMRNFKKINRKVKKIRKSRHFCVSQARSLLSYIGWLKQIHSGYKYYIGNIKPFVKLGSLKRVVSVQDRKMWGCPCTKAISH